MIGARVGNCQGVSGEGGSCFYRAIAFQCCKAENRRYDDGVEVARLRERVQRYLEQHGDEQPLGMKWKDMGAYANGYAEAPVPQVTAYVINRPVCVWLENIPHLYGKELSGMPLHVKLQGQHYSILYVT